VMVIVMMMVWWHIRDILGRQRKKARTSCLMVLMVEAV